MAEGVLGEIVARKRVDVARRFEDFDPRARAVPTSRSLRAALARKGARFVMEVKRISPSAGMLREGAEPAAVARAYAGAADAVSVLTDEPYFGGSLADLAAVRRAFEGPVLAKDFVIDVRQIAEARLAGADAVLVMLSVADDDLARGLIAEATRLNMDALVEVHDAAEARRAVALGAPLIGVNNRDLKTLKVDLATTERISPLIPADRTLVSESGVNDRADAARLAPHADAFLVGSALMRAENTARAARALAFGRVKICGLTTPDDAKRALAAGACFAGVIFAADSPRAVSRAKAALIAARAHAEGGDVVGVFRDAPPAEVAEIARDLRLGAVQLHGREDDAYIAELRRGLPEATEIWAACAVDKAPEPRRAGADRTVFDAALGGRSGGTGRAFDWSLIKDRADLASSVLAGGLTPSNAAAASAVGAHALDVSSGVERAPGAKDPEKLKAFFEALRLPSRGEKTVC
ncbi:MAG: bifunctional indole-3-glycerol-phosphate synthase TrpC/phosphoribosylanthranilate isomerase TrpF [Parvularculaceae bacterium]|nr:bifunctional indole-3-glycerol-phosphate synthase TrpC/phosphoribosylanthranilate isomerase TrpF [Parvularculaceae bacterium]